MIDTKYIPLYEKLMARTSSYIKTKDILMHQYGVDIYLEPVR